MFVNGAGKNWVNMKEGVKRQTLAVGEKSLLAKFILEEGAVLPMHSHPHEQIGFLISGEMVFTANGQETVVKAGDSWALPGGVEHAVRVVKRAEVIEVFVPVREDYRD